MSDPRQLRLFEYVNRPYATVRDRLRADLEGIFQRATTTAAARASELGATLRVELGGVELATDVNITVSSCEEAPDPLSRHPVTRLAFAWQARRNASLFPIMDAELSLYALSSSETQLDLLGRYRPPMGLLGSAFDAVVGHRLAEATMHRFLRDIAELLKAEG